MKYNLNIESLINNYSAFCKILEDCLEQNIDLSITFHDKNQKTKDLISTLEKNQFINVDKMLVINLNEYSQIVEQDKELEKSLKDHVKQKLSLNTDIQWMVDNNQIITDLDCKSIVEEYLNKLFILETEYKEYIDFLQTQRNVKTLCISKERPLKRYTQYLSQNMYTSFYIYGYKHFDISEIFKKQIIRQELNLRIFHVFTTYYIPKIKPWIEKNYYVYVEVDEEGEYITLYGPSNLVKDAEEIIMKEFKQLQLYHGIIKSDSLTVEQFEFLQVSEFLKESFYQQYEMTKNTSEIQQQLEESLKDIKCMAFQAAIFAEYQDGVLNENCIQCSNFDIDQQSVEQILESEVQKLAQNNKNGNCVGYFSIVYGVKLSAVLKQKLNEYLKVFTEEIHNQNHIHYLQKQDFSELQNYEMQFKLKIDSNNEKFIITGKQDQIQKFKDHLQNIIVSTFDIIDYYQYKNNFNIKAAMIDYKERYNQIIMQNECQVQANVQNTRIKLTGKQMNVQKLKQDLQELEQLIQEEKITKQFSIDIPKGINFSLLIKNIQQKYPSINIVAGACDEINIAQIYSFRRKQTRIKICNGSPIGLFDIKGELLKLNKALFIIPIEKVHQDIKKPQLSWEQELIEKRSIDIKSISETKQYKLITYSVEIIESNNQNLNQKDKKKKPKIENIEYFICQIYYKDYLKSENFIHYFDKETLNNSLKKLINEFQKIKPNQIYISCYNEEGQNYQQVIDYVIKEAYPKINIFFLMSQAENMESLKEDLLKNFDEEENQRLKITQHFTIFGCVQDSIQQVIGDLNNIQ